MQLLAPGLTAATTERVFGAEHHLPEYLLSVKLGVERLRVSQPAFPAIRKPPNTRQYNQLIQG